MTERDPRAEAWGQWLTEQLNRHRLTDTEFGELIDVQRPTVYRWRAGQYRPRPRKLPAIAEALGVELDLVLDAGGYRPYDLKPGGAVRRELAELIEAIPEELLLPLVPMLRGLADPNAQAETRRALKEALDDGRDE